jgi:hypothetical protein
VADVLRSALCGDLALFRLGSLDRGLGAFGARRSDIFAGKVLVNGEDRLTYPAAARILGFSPRQLQHMQEIGLIPRPHFFRPFTPQIMEVIWRDFVHSRHIADVLGVSCAMARSRITRAGAVPVVEGDIRAGIRPTWRTADIERVLKRRIRPVRMRLALGAR